MLPLVQPHLRDLIPYVPGKPIEETEREYGVTNIAKLASNENCLGPSPKAIEAVQKAATKANLYPDAGCFYLKQRICERHQDHGVTPDHVVVGNGTNEILMLIARAFLGPGEALLNAWPSFVVYKLAAHSLGRTEVVVPLDDELGYDFEAMLKAVESSEEPIKLVYLANPNNPIGRHFSKEALDGFLERLPRQVVVVLDEAYAEYVTATDYPDGVSVVMRSRPRTVVTRTFSKAFGLASMRVGYAICDPEVADVLNRLRDPFNVGALSQAAAMAALDDVDHVTRSREHNSVELPKLAKGLTDIGCKVTPSQANFVLAELPEGPLEGETHVGLLKKGVIVRPMKGYGLPRCARITVGTESENERVVASLAALIQQG